MSEISGLVTAGLTLLSLVAAVAATKYARDSAKAARDTVEPLVEMAARLKESVSAISELLQSNRELVDDMASALTMAERIRLEDRLTHRLAQYERVVLGVQGMWEGLRRLQQGMPDMHFREARATLRAALAPIPQEELPDCRSAAEQMVTGALGDYLQRADLEIRGAVHQVHKELNTHVKSMTKELGHGAV